MTYKEFKRRVFTIYNECYHGGDLGPIEYGLRRAEFEENKLGRLIGLAEETEFSTARRKVEGWRRQLERVHAIKARLEERRKESPLIANAYEHAHRVPPLIIANQRAQNSLRLR